MEDPGKRLKILTDEEIDDIYGFPQFTQYDRIEYFTLDQEEKKITNLHRSILTKVYFILQLGYFKAKKMFFVFSIDEIKEDIDYIINQYFSEAEAADFHYAEIPKMTRWAQQERILKIFDYKTIKQGEQNSLSLQEKAMQLAAIHAKPICLFRGLITFLTNYRIILPGYSTMQDTIGKGLANERNRVESLIIHNSTDDIKKSFEDFFNKESGLYEITLFRKEPKGFKLNEIKNEVNKINTLQKLYKFACNLIPDLNISNENIKYYASLIDYYTVYKLKRKSEFPYLYLLCFLFIRYKKGSNNLINSLIYHVNDYKTEAKAVAKETVYLKKTEDNENMDKAGKVLGFFTDESIPDKIEFGEIRQDAFKILGKDKFSSVSRYMKGLSFDETEYQWDHFKTLSLTFKKNLRPPFSVINFQSLIKNDPLIRAVSFIHEAQLKNKSLSQLNKSTFPLDFVPKKMKKYLYDQKIIINKKGKSSRVKELNTDKYEFLVYKLLSEGFESGDIFCKDSTQFRSIEDELIIKKYWDENKEDILKNIDYPKFRLSMEEILNRLQEELESLIIEVNKRIKDGLNKHIKIKGKGDNIEWTLPYKKPEDTENHAFFSHLKQVDIADVLRFVNNKCGFMNAFTHILGRYVKSKADNDTIIAGITALATNTGLATMGDISDISGQSLYTTAKNFFRLETISNANDIVSNEIAQNPFFRYYDIEEGVIHSSSDGQKFETKIKTINARHSPKYFGLKEGVTSYSLVANHVPINAKIIGANDHESYFVFDILYNNTSEITPDRHSTDSHGVNNANFLILYMFDYMFAPRYKDLNSKADKICGFKHQKKYKDCLIKPGKKARKQFILDEADNIFRIMASLALKTSTQSIIVKKLSSHSRKSKTLKAICELNNIINSIYILKYINDLLLRQGVQRALNRGESYHKLKKAVSHAYSGKFRVKTELEQQIWDECSRLVSNCIIFYNISILSELYDNLIKEGKNEEAELLKKISPVAWRHINLRGNYKFKKEDSINFNEIIDTLLKMSMSEYSTENEDYLN